jgi:hypothetical protein
MLWMLIWVHLKGLVWYLLEAASSSAIVCIIQNWIQDWFSRSNPTGGHLDTCIQAAWRSMWRNFFQTFWLLYYCQCRIQNIREGVIYENTSGIREYSKGDLSSFDSLECGEIGKCSKHFELSLLWL